MCWVKIHRTIFNESWAHKANNLALFVYLLAKAEYADGGLLKRGQVLVSSNELAKELGMTRQEVRTALKNLELTNQITNQVTNLLTNQPTKRATIVTICKYDDYNGIKNEVNQSSNQSVNQPFNQSSNQVGKEERVPPNNIYNNPSKEENIKEDKEKEKVVNTTSKKREGFIFEGLSEALRVKFEEFLQMRRKIGKPLKTQQGINSRIRELNKLSNENEELALAIIQQTLDNEWQSFYALKTELNKTTRPLTRYERDQLSRQQFHDDVAQSIQRDFENEQREQRGEDSEMYQLVW